VRNHRQPQLIEAAHHMDVCRGLVCKVDGERFHLRRIGGKTHPPDFALLFRAAADQHVMAQTACIGEPGVSPLRQDGADAAGQHQHRDQARADDPERDFLHARNRRVEDGFRCRNGREADQRNCVAGQDEGVAAGRAVEE